MTAFNGHVTVFNQGGMLVATTYRFGEDFNSPTLLGLGLCPQIPRALYIGISLFRCIIYGHANEQLLKHTANHRGVELEGNMK